MLRKVLLVVKSSPYGHLMAAEGFRIATAMIAMDVLPQLLFIDDGVYCLLKNQRPEAAGLNSHYERLKTLAVLVGLSAERNSMVKRDLRISDFDESFNVKLMSIDEAAKLIMKNETTITF
ncbi:MAG: DsrE family protein [Candidatus Bathyarchaeota archaeon]|nr:MAG: DsrE family protein [Candidatus Bathyarchaeota archaeon]